MRVLFTTQPGLGHFHPLIPLAGAAQDAGHEVAFACPAPFAPHVRAAGFAHFSVGLDWIETGIYDTFPALLALPPTGGAGRATYVHTYLFAHVTARRTLPDLLALGERWMPDLVVRGTEEYAGCVAAEHWGIPHASVQCTANNTYDFRLALAAQMDTLREGVGLPPDPTVEMPYRYLHLSSVPPALLPPDEPLAPTARFLRPVPFDRSGDEAVPAWVATLPDRPTVYATLGTVFNNAARPALAAILAALREEPITLILTVGRTVVPTEFGPQPENVHIERYIPQTLILPHCDAVVTHGGINTVLAALMHGKPLVLLPMGADHVANARGCEAMGAGRSVGAESRTPEAIREAVRAVLSEASYRENAERTRDEFASLPGPEYAVELLERLAVEKRPLRTS